MPKNNKKALIFALLAVLCWSTIGSATKITLRYCSADQMLLWANLSAFLFLWALNLKQNKTDIFRNLKPHDILRSAFMGLINPFLYYLLLFEAYDLLPAQEAGTLNYIWPVMLVLLSAVFLKENLPLFRFLAILLSFSGLVVIATKGTFVMEGVSNVRGIVLILISALLWASYWIFNMKDRRDAAGKLTLNFAFGLLYILIYQLASADPLQISLNGLSGSIYIGIFEMGLTFYLWMSALQYSTHTARISNLIYLSPFISLIFISIFVGESIHPATIVGLALIIGGIAWQERIRN